jgi:hypothetical protein
MLVTSSGGGAAIAVADAAGDGGGGRGAGAGSCGVGGCGAAQPESARRSGSAAVFTCANTIAHLAGYGNG